MSNDIAIFLDLDNLVIGAKQANLEFDIRLILDHIESTTQGRIVYRRSYGDWRQRRALMKELASAGFATISTVRINSASKNLADMQIVVDTLDTLLDGRHYGTYVLVSGDRDFTPLVQGLRKRGKQVIGVGIRQTTSPSLANLCDRFVYYEELLPQLPLSENQLEALVLAARDQLLTGQERVRASIFKEKMDSLSHNVLSRQLGNNDSFSLFLEGYPGLLQLQQEGTTIYVRRPDRAPAARPLHQRYRSSLKKQRLRVVLPARARLRILQDIIATLARPEELRWRALIDRLHDQYQQQGRLEMSKNMVNAMMLVGRRADVLRTLRGQSLSTAPVVLTVSGANLFQQALLRCDRAYLEEILALPEPFDLNEAALALYDSVGHAGYLGQLLRSLDGG